MKNLIQRLSSVALLAVALTLSLPFPALCINSAVPATRSALAFEEQVLPIGDISRVEVGEIYTYM